jgi:hypothetical protein
MNRLAWVLPLAAAVPLGADYQPVAAYGWPPNLPIIDTGAALVQGTRVPAYFNWVDPGPSPARMRSGLDTVVDLPGLPRAATVWATVEDRYDWLPTYGVNGEHDRPWLRVGSEWTFPRPGAQAFVGVGAMVPLTSATSDMLNPDPYVQAVSARGQVAIYAGVRF